MDAPSLYFHSPSMPKLVECPAHRYALGRYRGAKTFVGVAGWHHDAPLGDQYDAAIDAAFSGLAHAVDPLRGDKELTKSEWFYIYRWGVSPVHVSGEGSEDFYQEIGKLAVVEGRFHVSPHWRKDYEAVTRLMLEGLASVGLCHGSAQPRDYSA